MKIKPEHLPKLVELARNQHYLEAEGFRDATLTLKLPETEARGIHEMAEQLAEAAGVPLDVARSALIHAACCMVVAAFHSGDLAHGIAGWSERERLRAN